MCLYDVEYGKTKTKNSERNEDLCYAVLHFKTKMRKSSVLIYFKIFH